MDAKRDVLLTRTTLDESTNVEGINIPGTLHSLLQVLGLLVLVSFSNSPIGVAADELQSVTSILQVRLLDTYEDIVRDSR